MNPSSTIPFDKLIYTFFFNISSRNVSSTSTKFIAVPVCNVVAVETVETYYVKLIPDICMYPNVNTLDLYLIITSGF